METVTKGGNQMIEQLSDAINEIVFDTFQETVINYYECGHHDLNRNRVYQVNTSENRYILKFYYKPNKRIRELNALTYFHDAKLKILNYGIWKNYLEWSLYGYIDGDMLQSVIKVLTFENKAVIFDEIGQRMAKLHACKTFDYFGDWTVHKQSPLIEYKQFIIKDTERIIHNFQAIKAHQNIRDQKAVQIVRDEYRNIRTLDIGRLCHRDLDGRNLIVKAREDGMYHLEAILDFEKCVVFNEHLDTIGLFRKYFIESPELIPYFVKGYKKYHDISPSFNKELKFNLFRLGLDLSSWSQNVSKSFYDESIEYLRTLITIETDIINYHF